jgi:hypothetical protein
VGYAADALRERRTALERAREMACRS